MSRWKLLTIAILSSLPILVFAACGAWALFHFGYWFWLWWMLPICWGISAILAKRWAPDLVLQGPPLDTTHWSPTDNAALKIVENEVLQLPSLTPEQLANPQFYSQLTQSLALKIARHYHPDVENPLDSLSVVEILVAAQLIAEDVEESFTKYVPASHLVTVGQWKLLSKAPAWWQTASAAGWIASIAMNPLNLGRYLISRVAVDPLSKQIQENLLGAFYTMYVRQSGYHLIELNSGRLRAGSQRYRQFLKQLRPESVTSPKIPVSSIVANGLSDKPADSGGEATGPLSITIAVIGQVKAGKSSLINCLLGGQKAVMDILPATQNVARYTHHWPDRPEQLILLDTPGYSDTGATPQQLKETAEAVRQADLYVLVIDARSPARHAEVTSLAALEAWFTKHPRLKPPHMVVAVNKIDGLSPVMEWAPPYQWNPAVRPKEVSIAGAVQYAQEILGTRAAEIVPICADIEHQRAWGVQEFLVPALLRQLDVARATTLLRALHADYDRQKVRQVVHQILQAGKRVIESI